MPRLVIRTFYKPTRRSLRNARAKHFWAITQMRTAYQNADKFYQKNQIQRGLIWTTRAFMFQDLAHSYKRVIDAAEGKTHFCKICKESMNDYDFQRGKMCCDRPLFDDDEQPEDDSDFEDDEDTEEDETAEQAFDRKHPRATCHRCDTPVRGATVVHCGGAGGACETWYCADCHDDGTHDCPLADDDGH